jgi:hypothetical protein
VAHVVQVPGAVYHYVNTDLEVARTLGQVAAANDPMQDWRLFPLICECAM